MLIDFKRTSLHKAKIPTLSTADIWRCWVTTETVTFVFGKLKSNSVVPFLLVAQLRVHGMLEASLQCSAPKYISQGSEKPNNFLTLRTSVLLLCVLIAQRPSLARLLAVVSWPG